MLLGREDTRVEECVAGEEAVPFSAIVLFFRLHYALDDCNLRYFTPICAARKCYLRCSGPRKERIENRILMAKTPRPRDFFLNELNDSYFLVLKIHFFYAFSSPSDIKDGPFQFHGTQNIDFSVHPVWCLATRTN